jgi:hypothetical protein
MKNTLRNALIALLTCSSTAFAAGTTASTQGGFLISLFVGFFALILVFQLVPATIMLIGMVKGLLSGKEQVHY